MRTTQSAFGASTRARVGIAGLALSAAAYVGIAVHEAYRGEAYYATEHERQQGISTIGFGATENVKPGDRTTVERAMVRLLQDASKYEEAVRRCAPVPMFQHEFDAQVSAAYNIGINAWCKSSMAKRLNAGDYQGACDALLMWNKQAGQVLPGLVKRREQERQKCLGSK